MDVQGTAKQHFLTLANQLGPIPIMTDNKNIIISPPRPLTGALEITRGYYQLLPSKMKNAGHGTWIATEVNGQSINSSVGVPGYYNISYRSGVFKNNSTEEAFKSAWNNQSNMQFIEYAGDELKGSEENS